MYKASNVADSTDPCVMPVGELWGGRFNYSGGIHSTPPPDGGSWYLFPRRKVSGEL